MPKTISQMISDLLSEAEKFKSNKDVAVLITHLEASRQKRADEVLKYLWNRWDVFRNLIQAYPEIEKLAPTSTFISQIESFRIIVNSPCEHFKRLVDKGSEEFNSEMQPFRDILSSEPPIFSFSKKSDQFKVAEKFQKFRAIFQEAGELLDHDQIKSRSIFPPEKYVFYKERIKRKEEELAFVIEPLSRFGLVIDRLKSGDSTKKEFLIKKVKAILPDWAKMYQEARKEMESAKGKDAQTDRYKRYNILHDRVLEAAKSLLTALEKLATDKLLTEQEFSSICLLFTELFGEAALIKKSSGSVVSDRKETFPATGLSVPSPLPSPDSDDLREFHRFFGDGEPLVPSVECPGCDVSQSSTTGVTLRPPQ